MLYNLAIIIYDIAVHLAAPFSRKPRKMMKGHWVVYACSGNSWRRMHATFGSMRLPWASLNRGVR